MASVMMIRRKIGKSRAENIPPGRSLSSTMLKLRRHIGQLFARSTHGFKQLLCRMCPHGSNWAIWPGSSSTSPSALTLSSLEA